MKHVGLGQKIAVESVSFGPVHLEVIEAARSSGFWRNIVGLSRLGESEQGAVSLGVDGRELVVLHPVARRGVEPGHSGLYHLAIHLPDETEFARVLWRLIVAGHPHAPTDHIMSKSTYLTDPDGLALELTLETPSRLRSTETGPEGPRMIDSEGRPHAISEALDLNEVLSHLPDRDFDQPLLPSGTKVGHIHLHVSDLGQALAFYRDVIGFREHLYAPEYGFADLSAGGLFPHRIALNVWAGEGAGQAPAGTARLSHYTLIFPDQDSFSALRGRLTAAGHKLESLESPWGEIEIVRDPAGNVIALEVAAPP